MPGVNIKKGDEVMVMAGKDRGRSGRVVNVQPTEGRVMIEGIARAKKHSKPTKRVQQGGIIDKEQFIDLSNVQILCKSCGQPTRVGYRMDLAGKVRICRKCGGEL